MSSLPIGIFDSGVGGLTVLKAVREQLPNEDVIYLGDTARVPYGTKSPGTVERYAVEDASFLIQKGVKMIVVACNTASALAAPALRRRFTLPLLGVIGPGARAAARATRSGRIGVIGTEATVASGAYEGRIREACGDRTVEVFSQACPLFVPLAEEGETDSEITRAVAEKYLASLRGRLIDTLVLGCTHYPLLKPVIAEMMGEGVTLVDSAEAAAKETADLLAEKNLLNHRSGRATSRFYVTDAANRFHRIAERFLGGPLEHLEAVEVWGHDKLPAR
ncbi:MAG TPA: glutamate racemase [Blastocatellia bacterium]|nr:glutamate racemase [Blastocatellia bacterium]